MVYMDVHFSAGEKGFLHVRHFPDEHWFVRPPTSPMFHIFTCMEFKVALWRLLKRMWQDIRIIVLHFKRSSNIVYYIRPWCISNFSILERKWSILVGFPDKIEPVNTLLGFLRVFPEKYLALIMTLVTGIICSSISHLYSFLNFRAHCKTGIMRDVESIASIVYIQWSAGLLTAQECHLWKASGIIDFILCSALFTHLLNDRVHCIPFYGRKGFEDYARHYIVYNPMRRKTWWPRIICPWN